ncbi:hypothetical protein OSTOST_08558 [Ostertagia ostertagi]
MSNTFHRVSPFDNPEAAEVLLGNTALPQDSLLTFYYPDLFGARREALLFFFWTPHDQGTTISTAESSSMIAERDILLTVGQSGLSTEHRVEAGTEYRIHLPEHSSGMTYAQGGELVCFIRGGAA